MLNVNAVPASISGYVDPCGHLGPLEYDLIPPGASDLVILEDGTAERRALGRPFPAARPNALVLTNYLDEERLAGVLPAETNYRAKAARSIARTYRNDVEGNCVIAGKAHHVGVWSANDPDSGGEVLATDAEISAQYRSICGPGDRGCNIASVLKHMQARGLTLGGKAYKLDAYLALDWRSEVQIKAACYLFGGFTIGFALPSEWHRSANNAVWGPTNSRIVGGHDVAVIDYNAQGVVLSTWGGLRTMTWDVIRSTRWVDEAWVMVAPVQYGPDRRSVLGVAADRMIEDMRILAGGQLPPLPDDRPPQPPGPPDFPPIVGPVPPPGPPSPPVVVPPPPGPVVPPAPLPPGSHLADVKWEGTTTTGIPVKLEGTLVVNPNRR